MIRLSTGTCAALLVVCSVSLTSQEQHRGREANRNKSCGPLTRWKMPETTVVQATPSESRTHDVLVTQARIDAIILAAEAYCRLNGNVYPTTFQQMIEPPAKIAENMRGCRLDAENVVDSWDRPIFYAIVARRLVIKSAAGDGRFTTSDDIGRPDPTDQHVESFRIAEECARQ